MNVTVKDLLDAGVHFGHQVRRWNPKSKPYVYANRHGISIIDLEKTYDLLEKAAAGVEEVVANGKSVLLVGTKRQAQEPIREMAAATNLPFCVNRWMGGTLTNYETVSGSLAKYKKYLRMEEDGSLDDLPGKEAAAIKRQMLRMHRNFEGLLGLKNLPGAIFIVDTHKEAIAVAEANRLNIPIVALVDSNSDPTLIDFPIPGNDDSTKSIRIVIDVIVEAIQSGVTRRVEAPTHRRDITPVAQEPEFGGDQGDEPEVTLPEGYEDMDFDDRRRRRRDEEEEKPAEKTPAPELEAPAEEVVAEEKASVADEDETPAVEVATAEETPVAEEQSAGGDDVPAEEEQSADEIPVDKEVVAEGETTFVEEDETSADGDETPVEEVTVEEEVAAADVEIPAEEVEANVAEEEVSAVEEQPVAVDEASAEEDQPSDEGEAVVGEEEEPAAEEEEVKDKEEGEGKD